MTKPSYTEKDFETPYHECKNYYYDLEPQYDDKWILIFDSTLFYDDLKKIEKDYDVVTLYPKEGRMWVEIQDWREERREQIRAL